MTVLFICGKQSHRCTVSSALKVWIQQFNTVEVALRKLLRSQEIAVEIALDCVDIDVLDNDSVALASLSASNSLPAECEPS